MMNNLEARIGKLERLIKPLAGEEPVEVPVEAQKRAIEVLQAGFTKERLDECLDPNRKKPMDLTREEAQAWAVARGILEEATREAKR